MFSRISARREVGVTSRSCGNLQHFSFWTRKMRLVPRFPSRKCISYCEVQAKVLFWTCLKLTAKSRFVLKLPTRTTRARSFYGFRAGSQVRQKLLRSCGANGLSKVPLVYEKLHIWVKLGVTIYCDLGNQPLWEKGSKIFQVRSSI